MACHLLGMAEMAASVREQVRQMRAAKRAGGVFIDALTGLQIRERAAMGPEEVVACLADAGPRAARGRARAPGIIRRRPMPDLQRVGGRPENPSERWTFGYLVDVILTRDTWMHRTDIAQATGGELQLTPEHDGVLVDDVVSEWAARHRSAVTLVLTGPAGGNWTWAGGGPEIVLDAVEFCRLLAGCGHGEGLLAVEVPF